MVRGIRKRIKIERILSEIETRIKRSVCDLKPLRYLECDYKQNNILPEVNEQWAVFDQDHCFGGYEKHFWLHKHFVTPSCGEQEELRLQVLPSPKKWGSNTFNTQCLLYLNGKIEQGFDIYHCEHVLQPDTEYDMYLYLYTGMSNAYFDELDISILCVHRVIEKLFYDLQVPYLAAETYEEGTYEYNEILKHLECAVNLLDLTEEGWSERFLETVPAAITYMDENFYGQYPSEDIQVDCIGHTHIDVAWLWRYIQTKEKAQRSYATLLTMMDRYPQYRFTISQPQLLQYVKEGAPEVYEGIQKLVKQGRIEVEGAMWVEPDCNLISGESFVRQLIYGKKFFKDEFGVDSQILWLPDVFGYSASLPQILKKAGVNKFVTSKIGWNEYNKMPYDIFLWKGIDGTEIMSYFIMGRELAKPGEDDTMTDYNGRMYPNFIRGTWERFQQKEYSNETFMTFGFGDGGGGPTLEMLEQEQRIARGVLGVPKTKITSAKESLDAIEQKFMTVAKKSGRVPKWVGELYLELHRGTYTNIAKVKKYNRKMEFLSQNTEQLAAMNLLFTGGSYPKETLDACWKKIILNQFHDVLPGSSIFDVYKDAFAMYEEVEQALKKEEQAALQSLAENICADCGYVVFNPNGYAITDVVSLPGGYRTCHDVPPHGWKVIEDYPEESTVAVAERCLENAWYRLLFDENYDIVSIYDKIQDREVVVPGKKANEFIMYEDLPFYEHEAWDIGQYHKYKSYRIDELCGVTQVQEGARAGFEIVKRFRKSTICQRIFLYNELPRVDFETSVDWHQQNVVMKVAFPVDVNTAKATYDIQFGNIERTHHENTSWDEARFESCGHKWADISDGGYGLALMNDCKYGYSVIDDTTIQLSLLRGSLNPVNQPFRGEKNEGHNDQGMHHFVYSILPHKGDFRTGEVVKHAYALNNPLQVTPTAGCSGTLPSEFSFVSADKENVVVESVKRAEESGDIIVRMFDAYNRKEKVTVSFGANVKKVFVCDLLEHEERELPVENNKVVLAVSNYEIVTLKLCF